MAKVAANRKKVSRKLVTAVRIGSMLIGCALVAYVAQMMFHHDDCSDELLVNGQKLDLSAAVSALNLKASASPTAQQVISDRLQFFIARSSGLCRDSKAGRIDESAYVKQSEEVSRWFMNIERLAASGKLQNIGPDSKDDLAAALQPVPVRAPESLATVTLSNSDGAIIPDGATIHRGDRLALDIDVPSRSYLYVVDVGSSGSLSRIFPSALAGPENPVTGKLRIPADKGSYMKVGGPQGREQILVYVADQRDESIERLFEIQDASKDKIPADAKALHDAIVVRDLFAEPPAPKPAKSTNKPEPVDASSRFGKALVSFSLNNAG